MTTTAIPTRASARPPELELRNRAGCDRAVTIADEALANGDPGTAERICWQVLQRDLEHEGAFALLQCVLLRGNRPMEAVGLADRVMSHLRGLLSRHSTAYGLHLLHERGFRPAGVLDIGAYHGEFAVMARQFWPEAAVLMVEPQPQKRDVLVAVAAQLGGEIDVCTTLLGDAERAACAFHQLRTPFGSTGSSLYQEASDYPRDTLHLPMTTVDALLAGRTGRQYDLWKIDVQGAELDVLRGAKQALRGVEALLVELSLHVVNHGAPLIAEVIAEFDRLGFALFELLQLPRDGSGLQLQTDAVFVRKGSSLWPKPGGAPA